MSFKKYYTHEENQFKALEQNRIDFYCSITGRQSGKHYTTIWFRIPETYVNYLPLQLTCCLTILSKYTAYTCGSTWQEKKSPGGPAGLSIRDSQLQADQQSHCISLQQSPSPRILSDPLHSSNLQNHLPALTSSQFMVLLPNVLRKQKHLEKSFQVHPSSQLPIQISGSPTGPSLLTVQMLPTFLAKANLRLVQDPISSHILKDTHPHHISSILFLYWIFATNITCYSLNSIFPFQQLFYFLLS